jgi:hypothetical protein
LTGNVAASAEKHSSRETRGVGLDALSVPEMRDPVEVGNQE